MGIQWHTYSVSPTKLIWSDEFDIDGAPDSTKWDYDVGDGCNKGLCGWGNNELQWYTSDNAVVADGVLRISAKKESVNGREYTSSRMVTRGKHIFRYGRIRFRARTSGCTARGTWSALWLLPEDWVYGGWPNSGEIDVMEAVGYEENKFHGGFHTGADDHTKKTGSITKSELDWHIFDIDWQEDKIIFAVNGEVYLTYAPDDVNDSANWPFDQDFHLLLNIAVGGNWGGAQGVDEAAFEGTGQYMELDWVRVYSS
jgi:beta-glucanase (GH16 family)